MKLGEKQVLTVVKKVEFGVYLGSEEQRNMDKDHRCRTCHYFTANYHLQSVGSPVFQMLSQEKEG